MIPQPRLRLTGLLLLLLFLFSVPTSPAFLHTHTLPSGKIIVHSHLFPRQEQNDSSKPFHQHSDQSFLWHHLFSLGFDVHGPETSFTGGLSHILILPVLTTQIYKQVTIHYFILWRAPPR